MQLRATIQLAGKTMTGVNHPARHRAPRTHHASQPPWRENSINGRRGQLGLRGAFLVGRRPGARTAAGTVSVL